ncbi:DUF2634 domain-containing protein [Ureibacillus sp. Re31]|uniref:DUF2634 domain-containing protein n=1 Tax=Ureibacillus galli TaxID=2762222 RepID=A0ABR8XAR0_9BACL|nr:DUF2634 domain-containing protein [Ureibacillus galli]MBD8026415.1 DUF2634 domain-containing protein [Ureibacillus galli]
MIDLALKDGDLIVVDDDFTTIDGPESSAQGLEISLGTNLKEWFLDEEFGLDFNRILGKSTDEEARAEILRALAQDEEIDTIDSLEIISNYQDRKRKISFTVTLVDGNAISREVYLDAG